MRPVACGDRSYRSNYPPLSWIFAYSIETRAGGDYNWPHCSLRMARSFVTIFVRPLTSSDWLPRHDGSRQCLPNCLVERTRICLKMVMRPWPTAMLLACVRPLPRERRARQLSSIRKARATARMATADLNWAAFLIDSNAFGLRPSWSTSP